MFLTTIAHVEGAFVTWKDQVRFVKFVDQPDTVNIANSEIGVLLELSSQEVCSQQKIQSIIGNHWIM
jgi:hypothetical protein